MAQVKIVVLPGEGIPLPANIPFPFDVVVLPRERMSVPASNPFPFDVTDTIPDVSPTVASPVIRKPPVWTQLLSNIVGIEPADLQAPPDATIIIEATRSELTQIRDLAKFVESPQVTNPIYVTMLRSSDE